MTGMRAAACLVVLSSLAEGQQKTRLKAAYDAGQEAAGLIAGSILGMQALVPAAVAAKPMTQAVAAITMGTD